MINFLQPIPGDQLMPASTLCAPSLSLGEPLIQYTISESHLVNTRKRSDTNRTVIRINPECVCYIIITPRIKLIFNFDSSNHLIAQWFISSHISMQHQVLYLYK